MTGYSRLNHQGVTVIVFPPLTDDSWSRTGYVNQMHEFFPVMYIRYKSAVVYYMAFCFTDTQRKTNLINEKNTEWQSWQLFTETTTTPPSQHATQVLISSLGLIILHWSCLSQLNCFSKSLSVPNWKHYIVYFDLNAGSHSTQHDRNMIC